MKTKTKKLISLSIIGFLYLLILNVNFNLSNNYKPEVDKSRISATAEFIIIDALATTNTTYYGNWSWARAQSWCTVGDGTEENPYIIEDLTISSPPAIDCLTIKNSRKYFIVRNCILKDIPVVSFAGLRLDNVTNAIIIDNQVYNNSRGFEFNNVNNSQIINNNCSFNTGYGIRLSDCYYNTISENIGSDNDYGLYFNSKCDNNTISGNTAHFNTHFGIYLDGGDYNNITGNTAYDNDIGIYFDQYCDYNTLSGNTVNNNTQYGIYLTVNCTSNTISGNNANNNTQYGIYLTTDCNNNTILGNIVNDNTHGIYIDYSDYNNITGNIANDHIGDIGIYLFGSDYNIVSGNTANNNGDGIAITTSNYNTISENILNGNNDGIYIFDANNNIIMGNTISDNDLHGIYFEEDSDYQEISENIMYNNTIGIYINGLNQDNSIYENFFLKNGKHAIDAGINNIWNSTSIGNYWDNHTSPDNNHDGIVDTPYTGIGGSVGSIDYLPIAEDGAPRITIISPSEGQRFGITSPTFNVEIIDIYIVSMWYTIDGGLNNHTFIGNGTINQTVWHTLPEGNVIITFYARDIAGNVSFKEVTVVKYFGLDPGVLAVIVVVSIIGGLVLVGAILGILAKKGKISLEKFKKLLLKRK